MGHMNELQNIYPDVYLAIRIMMTMSVNTAFAKKLFSKLKIIKNYLRNTMKQNRLSTLGILSIDAELPSNINYKSLLELFSNAKSRRVLVL